MTSHDQRYAFCRVTYWKNNIAAKSDEEWTVCRVGPLGPYGYGEQSFENNEQAISRRDSLIAFLEKAYESGRYDAKKEIREVLGVKEPR
ncbi:hypothetical protein HFO71_24335 [Rhizobium laguerreae]|uniref:hypothetical protein n=1 Tax=Rhizobium laguerreae TaxID=1076926 RepID=UPI001C919DDF|nr:hypothetical protein [Rhizobium laguerreae]MBY3073446.1 hypothetical protein [Rhizobium laguerreae]